MNATVTVATAVAGLALLACGLRGRRRLLLAVVGAALLAGACGSHNVSNEPPAGNGTPGGTYLLTIQAISGTNTQTVTETLVVH